MAKQATSAESKEPTRVRPFTFALAPTLGGAKRDRLVYAEPFRLYLERTLDRPVRLVVAPSYQETIKALRDQDADAAMLGEFATRQGELAGGVVPLVAAVGANEETPTYRSVVVTRIDTGIHDLNGLRGTTIGLVDEQSTSGYLVPRAMLREAGLDPDRDVTMRLFGRHRAVIEAVVSGEIVAGAAHASRLNPPALDRGPEYARLRVLATSRPIPTGPLVVRSSLEQETQRRLADAMLRVHEADTVAAAVVIRNGHRFTVATQRRNPTLKSIAALSGVSYATVSRVVNRSGYVAPATAARVNAIIKEIGYLPNGNARLLQGQQPPLVGFVTTLGGTKPDATTARVVPRVQASFVSAGVPLVLCPVDGPLQESLYLDLLRERRIGALLVTGEHAADPDLIALARMGYAIVALDAPQPAAGMIAATMDDAAAVVLSMLGWAPRPRGTRRQRG